MNRARQTPCAHAGIAAWLLLLSAAAGATDVSLPAPMLSMPSPDWRDQVIYFAMTDRFANGDPGNDDQGAGEFDPASNARYNGGDLRGLQSHLDYIRGLGATALWITPPVANQWRDAAGGYAGYHGYWAEDFTRVDAHLGTLADYRALSGALHGAGMYLVQDIVLNHTGNYFGYAGGWRADDPAWHYQRLPQPTGRQAPTQYPFSLNDPRDPRQRQAAIYHWTPDVTDYNDPAQLLNWQMAGLDDLNTENPQVRQALRDSYDGWIRDAGVDAFRVDTALYVPPSLFRDFLYGDDPAHPGVMRAAAASGRRDFFVFGEGFAVDKPYDDAQSRRIAAYMRDPDGRKLMPGMLNFPLYAALGDVFARGRPTAELGDRLRRQARVFPDVHRLPTFVDNHDVDRFLAGGSEAALRQALLAIMTLPGIPVIYYGTEQGFREPRAAMFAGGFGAGGRDHYDTTAPLYRYLRDVIALRRGHRVFSRGDPEILRESATGPGAFAYRMQEGRDAALVVFNTADHPVLVDHLPIGQEPGGRLVGLYGIDAMPPDLVADRRGQVTFALPPRAGWVWLATAATAPRPSSPASAGSRLALAPLAVGERSGDFVVAGRAEADSELRLVVDGDLERASQIVPKPDGRWQARVDTGAMIDPAVTHSLVLWSARTGEASERREFVVKRRWRSLADVVDAADDDAGPEHRYAYPDDAGWRAHRQGDLRRIQVAGSGGALALRLHMADVTSQWNPPNGFDHVAFTVFIGLPGREDGQRTMPLQNARLPGDMRWQYRLRVHGWSNALFSAEGADAGHEGAPVTPAADIKVDRQARTIELRLPPAALGGIRSLAGVRLYVTTWDYDGGYRPLRPVPGPGNFGGGDGAADPLVLDDAPVITLP